MEYSGLATMLTETRGRSLTRAARLVAPALPPLLAAGLGALFVTRRPLSVDEAASAADAARGLGSSLRLGLDHDPSSLGHRALVWLADVATLGGGWTRISSVAAVVLGVLAAMWLAWQLGGRLAAVAAGVLLAISSGTTEAAQTVAPYALALASSLTATAVLVRWRRGWHWSWGVLYALLVVVLPLTHPVAAAVLVAHAAYLWLARPRPAWRQLAPAFVGAGIAALPLAAAAADRAGDTGEGNLGFRTLGEAVARAAGWNPVVVGLAALALVLLARHGKGAEAALLGGAVLAPPAASLLAGTGLEVHAGAAVSPLAGPLAVAAGIGLAGLRGRRELAAAAAAGATVAAAVALGWWHTREPAEDWRGAARAVIAGRLPGETIVVSRPRAAAAWRDVAPDLTPILAARGSGAWLLLDGDRSDALARGRLLAHPPRYALLEEQQLGSRLTLQHWVRP